MSDTTFIYIIHSESDERNSVYVGKADDPRLRLRQHKASRQKDRVGYWMRKYRWRRMRMVVLEEVPVGEWREAETFWIAYFRSIGANVINQTDGGQGFTPDSETRERWLRSVRAAVERPEHREKMRRINAEYWADPANRARHSKKMQRVYRDPEKRKRMVEASQAAMRGRRRKPRPTPAE